MSYLIFDGVNLTDRYGLVISGAGSFDGPARVVESFGVPGRNGNLLTDSRRYENAEITYAGCGLKKKDVGNIDDLRAFLSAHQDAYYDLADSYHPNEIRKARFLGPFAPTMTAGLRLAEFDLAFDAKPLRYLLNGAEMTAAMGGNLSLTQPEKKAFADFSAATQAAILYFADMAGYSAAEASGMSYLALDYSSGKSGLIVSHAYEIRVGYDDPFFFCQTVNDPTTTTEAGIGGNVRRKIGYSSLNNNNYLIIPYGFNPRIVDMADDSVLWSCNGFRTFTIVNPTDVPAKPLIKVSLPLFSLWTAGTYVFGVNDCGMILSLVTASTITVDAETMNAYSLPEDNSDAFLANFNSRVSFSEDEITLKPGENTILVAKGASVQLVPNWVTL